MEKADNIKNAIAVVYKILADLLFLFLLFFLLLILLDSIASWLVPPHFSFTKIMLIIVGIIGIIIYLGRKYDFAVFETDSENEFSLRKNKLYFISIIVFILLISKSLLAFPFWQNIAITLAAVIAYIIFHKLFFSRP